MRTPPHWRYPVIYREINDIITFEGRWDNVTKDLIHLVKKDKNISIYLDGRWLSTFFEPCDHSDEEECYEQCSEEDAEISVTLSRGIKSYIYDHTPKDVNWEYTEDSFKRTKYSVIPDLSFLPST